jgi:hypothetical protein
MPDYLRYFWRRQALQMSARGVRRACDARMAKAKAQKRPQHEIDDLRLTNDDDLKEITDERESLESNVLVGRAVTLDVALPERNDVEFWERSLFTGQIYLTAAGRRVVRAAIRAERKERFEVVRAWLPSIMAVLAAAAAFLGALRGPHIP